MQLKKTPFNFLLVLFICLPAISIADDNSCPLSAAIVSLTNYVDPNPPYRYTAPPGWRVVQADWPDCGYEPVVVFDKASIVIDFDNIQKEVIAIKTLQCSYNVGNQGGSAFVIEKTLPIAISKTREELENSGWKMEQDNKTLTCSGWDPSACTWSTSPKP